MLSLCLSLGLGAFITVCLTNDIYSALSEHAWQDGYCRSCSLTEGWSGPGNTCFTQETCRRVPGVAVGLAKGCFIMSVHAGCPVALLLPVKAFSTSWVGQEES